MNIRLRHILFLSCSILLHSLPSHAQKTRQGKVYYPSLKVMYNGEDPIIVNIDGKMYNRPSRSIQVDQITSGKHMLTVYRVKIKRNGKRKYYELFNGRINIRPERINLAQVYRNGVLRVRYAPIGEDMPYVDKREGRKKKLRRVEVIKPVYKEEYNDSSRKFMTLMHRVDETQYETSKVGEVKKYLIEAGGISVSQIMTLSESFIFDSSRMELVEATRKYIIDTENLDQLEQIFDNPENKDRFRELVY